MHRLWIDALQFSDYGGWQSETQFVREMGQGYLLALNTPGIPAGDAKTAFSVPQKATYRVWVRTKNWLKGHAPGRFAALVDGGRIGGELGNLPSDIWRWQIAGDAELSPGAHTLSIRDVTGYFPRFAAVLITDDMDYTPSPEWERIRPERAEMLGQTDEIRRLPPFDVVVAGAGPGGIPAAIAAAREGAGVALVHSRPVIGGNSSDEAGVGFDGAYIHHPGMRESGIAEEIRRIRDANGYSWQKALETLCGAEKNLTVFVNQCVIDAEMDGGRITAAIAMNPMDGVRTAFAGRMFIDATGDGWLGYFAGAASRVGREAFWQHGEEKAPRHADGRTMSGCLMGNGLSYRSEDCGEPAPFCAPKWAQILPEKLFRDPGHRVGQGHWWIENPTDYDDLFEAEMVRDQLMVISLGYFHWLKNDYARRDLVANHKIVGFPRYNAKRESRRLVGDYILKQDDCTSGRAFDDVIAYAGWTIDVHNQDGIFSGLSGPYDFDIRVPVNQIPYRAIYSKNVDNLMMAGRCISVTHIALGTVRVENTLATIGQAAGTAAAMAAAQGLTPREIGQTRIKALQQRLLRNDCYIPGLCNEDEADLARTAAITATSQSRAEVFAPKRGVPGDWRKIDETIMILMRGTPSSTYQLYVRNGGGAAKLACEWAEIPAADTPDVVEAVTADIPANFTGYVDIPLTKEIRTASAALRLLPNPQIMTQYLNLADHGNAVAVYRAPYWPAQRNTTFVHRLKDDPAPPPADCSPKQVVSGISRPVSANEYAWVSDPGEKLPQEITLTFPQPRDIGTLQLTFDTDLNNPCFSFEQQPVVPGLVKDYDILADGKTVEEVRQSNARMRRHALGVKAVTAITVRVLATYGAPSARIFEIRAYE